MDHQTEVLGVGLPPQEGDHFHVECQKNSLGNLTLSPSTSERSLHPVKRARLEEELPASNERLTECLPNVQSKYLQDARSERLPDPQSDYLRDPPSKHLPDAGTGSLPDTGFKDRLKSQTDLNGPTSSVTRLNVEQSDGIELPPFREYTVNEPNIATTKSISESLRVCMNYEYVYDPTNVSVGNEQASEIRKPMEVLRTKICSELDTAPNIYTPNVQGDVNDVREFDRQSTDFDQPGIKLVAHAGGLFQTSSDNFLKGCKWSPDGGKILANSGSNSLQLFHLSPDLLSDQHRSNFSSELVSGAKITPGEVVYDFCWHPSVDRHSPLAGCFVTTSRDHPVHLWNSTSGELQCSYRAFDHVDELSSAYSLTFSPSGLKLYCGFNKMIRVFDIDRPGRFCQSRPTFLKQGQSGIISCMAFSPTDVTLYAAGSYARTVALYTEPAGQMMCMFQGQIGGVTHLEFSPDGTKLFSGGRKDPEILCWDIRNPGNILFTLQRQVTTNQRMYFDLDSTGRYVISGNQGGSVHIWDSLASARIISAGGEPVLEPLLTYRAHNDTVNSISCHPTSFTLVTGSGQRHFSLPGGGGGEESDASDDDESDAFDNSLKVWTIDPSRF